MKYLFFFFTLFFSLNTYAQTDSLSSNKGFVIKGAKNNQPLLVVDGYALNTDTEQEYQKQVNKINPDNIEKVEVLKGDTPNISAMYGARGANGVILITTKKKKKEKDK